MRRIPALDGPGAGVESAFRKWRPHPPVSEVLGRTYNAHMLCASQANPQGMTSPKRAKKAVNLSISADVLEAARSHEINLSATLESALEVQLRQRRRNEWLATNGDSIEAYNRDVEKRGTFGDSLRSF